VEKAALVFSLKLDNGHKLLCPWIDNACSETLARFPPTTPEILVENFREHCFALLQLSALPRISSSAIAYIKSQSPLLEDFLGKSLMLECGNGSTENSGIVDFNTQEELKLYYQVISGFLVSSKISFSVSVWQLFLELVYVIGYVGLVFVYISLILNKHGTCLLDRIFYICLQAYALN